MADLLTALATSAYVFAVLTIRDEVERRWCRDPFHDGPYMLALRFSPHKRKVWEE